VSSIKQSSGGEIDGRVAGPDTARGDDETADGDSETTLIGEPTEDTEDTGGESSTEVGEGVSVRTGTSEYENAPSVGSSLAGQDGDSEAPLMDESTGEVTAALDHAGGSAETKDEAPSETTGGNDSLARHSAHSKG
jgi:hypothetical protein